MAQVASYTRLESKLGVQGIHSDTDLAELVERRLPATAVKALVRGGLTDAEAWQLIVPRRTLAHRIARREPLSRDESDKAVRVARVVVQAEQVFDDPARAWRWMRKPKELFSRRTPLELLATDAGARLVEDLLIQIDHGMGA
jgi:putative toxin-antitoxin system antitoxin component (TIGR02293 family)